ncbi:MAG: hypothetical protein Q8T11_00945 [Elusimicrobiota bacterium]|nr:hypothetical protein [Elusimicrobiota bacterium]
MRLLLLASLLFGQNALAAGIYFQRDDAKPWQNCYAIAPQDALRSLVARDFKGAALIDIERVRLEGETIRVSHRDTRGITREITFEKCPFDEADRRRLITCEVTVQTAQAAGRIAHLGHLPEIEARWRRKDPAARVIDCRAGIVRPVRNSWRQDFTLADYKLIRRINELRAPLVPMTAFGTVTKGAGTNRLQDWRATVGFEFMENRMQPEICDASVEELSLTENLDSWLGARNGAWCPWGLEIVALSCDGLPLVESAAAPSRVPLDPASPEVAAYCGAKP